MAQSKRRPRRQGEHTEDQSQEHAQYMIASLYEKYKQHALPNEEMRRLLDQEMGDKTLTEVLYEMREGR